ncbi:uncharacterized protein LOC119507776 [Choloepus didactylus]|uniref:uncharacterized protein LOC119507776 n=1 Tax=Choloepus didactylus TaxID=27675 RepID=UPI00189DED08|nr:uncharacterized protein LOC119507776 [Choloepus didactylus]
MHGAPNTAPARPQGPRSLARSVPGDKEAGGGRGALGSAEAGEGKANRKAVAQHKMRQRSKVGWGDLWQSWHRGHSTGGWARSLGRGRPPDPRGGSQPSPEPLVPATRKGDGRRKETRPEANSRDTHRASRVAQGGEAVLGNARGSETVLPGCEQSRRRAGQAEGVRELRCPAVTEGGAGNGKEHRNAPRNSAPFAPAAGGDASRLKGAVEDSETGQGLTLRSRRVTSIAPRLCKSLNPSGSDAAVFADASGKNRHGSLSFAEPARSICPLSRLLSREFVKPHTEPFPTGQGDVTQKHSRHPEEEEDALASGCPSALMERDLRGAQTRVTEEESDSPQWTWDGWFLHLPQSPIYRLLRPKEKSTGMNFLLRTIEP